jgi:SAM-dependent methyltransferase
MPINKKGEKTLHLYSDLADWFHLLTAPEDYKEEAEFYSRMIIKNSSIPVKTVLELGSGGGNNASHLKAYFEMTLSDLSEDMLNISRGLNPECEHIQGDMRNVRLGKQFDAVFIQDAISYLNTETDLSAAIETSFLHCKPGGVALFAPDHLRETFKPFTQHGGHDGDSRAMRYLEWTWDPDPTDTNYFVDFAYLLRKDNITTCEYERHTLGLFSENDWRRLLVNTGFTKVSVIPYPKTMKLLTPVFVGTKPE